MRSLKFQRLVLISDSKRLANQFSFQKRLNLITGKDNSIGKSTLAKSLLWSLGCDPVFDEEWKSNDIKSILYFTLNNKEYFSCRGSHSIILGAIGDEAQRYINITGDFSKGFSDLVNFKMKLPNRGDGNLETPPPAYYFLPFYIDQIKSWSSPWNSFENLGQYSNWKGPLIKYFTGYLKPEHFDIEENIYEYSEIKKESAHKIEKFQSAVEVIVDNTVDSPITLDNNDFIKIQNEIKNELYDLIDYQTRLYDAQATITSNIYDLESQYALAITSANELEADYKFAVESIPTDYLECPLCGTLHDNSLPNRALLLSEKDSLLNEANSIASKIVELKSSLNSLNEDAQFITNEIERINNKYITDDDAVKKGLIAQVIDTLSTENVSKNIQIKIDNEDLNISKANSSIKELKKDQKKLLSTKEKEELNSSFMSKLLANIEALGSTGINLSKVKSPTDYKQLLGGGAAEAARGLLAYQLSVLQQIHGAKTCVVPPFVIDTPNQQEQAGYRYETVIKELMRSVPQDYQIILCAMENDALNEFKHDANVIVLNSNRLLTASQYDSLRSEYKSIQAIVTDQSDKE
ncbi:MULTISPECIES: hypothetical protein [Photorhabdus]|uniref:Photorhabdus luminescens subsp. laumondii TTO1 complete genome segment 7/17 n=1 Tax=Photorhabdus laumondii subsp. laumondii (strain DSM 15139 / CIP 105565 / TT01) TaxID=243265 RepID=Q7N5U5_PHOLL|nr:MULTISPECIES: hypothetical protein [Photorhabdus]RAW70875.1 hypothetical protein CKY14_13635 [Photorhabdus sp. S14-60]AXG46979.1 hypothetical protein PluTT01m_09465 [Photorhabdus laumondii subsp. laumondii]RAW69572.1 hypothetical protein CKY15_13820 [Photorhabdus sp. S7-51]RAW77140.1 hypothetical protein CKY06_13925 [Photorhabdus sp. S15-56]CAE14130.1 unnamed protein product [Photorhabdus laumondii subsp. laumondii TTO1]